MLLRGKLLPRSEHSTNQRALTPCLPPSSGLCNPDCKQEGRPPTHDSSVPGENQVCGCDFRTNGVCAFTDTGTPEQQEHALRLLEHVNFWIGAIGLWIECLWTSDLLLLLLLHGAQPSAGNRARVCQHL